MNRLVAKVVDVRRQEVSTALLMFAYSFLAMTSYNIVKHFEDRIATRGEAAVLYSM